MFNNPLAIGLMGFFVIDLSIHWLALLNNADIITIIY